MDLKYFHKKTKAKQNVWLLFDQGHPNPFIFDSLSLIFILQIYDKIF